MQFWPLPCPWFMPKAAAMRLAQSIGKAPMRRMILILTLAMALLGQMVPQGVMPTMAGDGVLRMTICSDSAMTTQEMVLTEAGNLIPADVHDAGDNGDKADGFCPFASGSLAMAPNAPADIAAYQVIGLSPTAPPVPAVAMGAASPLPPATGPPAFS